MKFQNYFLNVLTDKYFEFEGRASRSEYWYFVLFKWLIIIASLFLSSILGAAFGGFGNLLFGVSYLVLFIPSLAATVRRLHDVGESGWLILVRIIPLIGNIIIFIFLVQEGHARPNKYGQDPRLIDEHNIGRSDVLDDLVR